MTWLQSCGQDDEKRAAAARAVEEVESRPSSRHDRADLACRGQSAQDRNSSSGTGEDVTNQTTATGQTKTGTNLTAQRQTTLQQPVLHASNAPRINENSFNFQVYAGVSVPSAGVGRPVAIAFGKKGWASWLNAVEGFFANSPSGGSSEASSGPSSTSGHHSPPPRRN